MVLEFTWSISAGNKFVLHEGIELQIRADATNAFNHPSFGQPSFDLVSGGDGSTDANPFFGSPTNITTLTVGGRTLQLNARLSF
jgi:hypothetical protein